MSWNVNRKELHSRHATRKPGSLVSRCQERTCRAVEPMESNVGPVLRLTTCRSLEQNYWDPLAESHKKKLEMTPTFLANQSACKAAK